MLPYFSSHHSWEIVVNNIFRPWVALLGSVFPNAIDEFISKHYFSWKIIWEQKVCEQVLFNCCNLVLSNFQKFL